MRFMIASEHIEKFQFYTNTVSRVTYTVECHVCITARLGEFRYERYESVHIVPMSV